jgi:hypothetical protein
MLSAVGTVKALKFKLGEQVLEAKLQSKVDKKSLYGFARKSVEKDGRPLLRGVLCPDGVVLKREEITSTYVDPEGSPVEEIVTELEGKPVPVQPSSFDLEAPLEEVPLKTLVGFNVSDVYPLEELALKQGLYRTQFSYRKTCFFKEAFILVRETDAFLLVGRMRSTALVGLNVAYEFFDAESEPAEEGEELDFSMV